MQVNQIISIFPVRSLHQFSSFGFFEKNIDEKGSFKKLPMDALQHFHKNFHPYAVVMKIHKPLCRLIGKKFLMQRGELFAEAQGLFCGRYLAAVHHDEAAPQRMAEGIAHTVGGICSGEIFFCQHKSPKSSIKSQCRQDRIWKGEPQKLQQFPEGEVSESSVEDGCGIPHYEKSHRVVRFFLIFGFKIIRRRADSLFWKPFL